MWYGVSTYWTCHKVLARFPGILGGCAMFCDNSWNYARVAKISGIIARAGIGGAIFQKHPGHVRNLIDSV